MGCGSSSEAATPAAASRLTPLEKKCMQAISKAKSEGKYTSTDLKETLAQMPQMDAFFAECKQSFDKYDVNKSGSLDFAEVEKWALDLHLTANTDSSQLKQMFEECDVDCSADMTLDEVIIYIVLVHLALGDKVLNSVEVALNVMIPTWCIFDKDQNGTISIPEARQIGADQGNETLAGKLFDSMDGDDDGEITFREFLGGFEGLKKYKKLA